MSTPTKFGGVPRNHGKSPLPLRITAYFHIHKHNHKYIYIALDNTQSHFIFIRNYRVE